MPGGVALCGPTYSDRYKKHAKINLLICKQNAPRLCAGRGEID
ncbi:hypothetical protein HMPREF0208_02706 [Citrobacter koseri]|nr:hypothetical protein HMPREF3220_03954 [Citrobacter koseri]KXA03740.1 hypothetical protein HMPREF3207_01630 [Citrobacter koseri]KXB43315.1 hypothetical protein HMPREF0208_02706 [Citrobacter koseri]